MAADQKDDSKRINRRNFLKGAGAGAVVGAAIVAGIEEGIRIPAQQGSTTTTMITQPSTSGSQTSTTQPSGPAYTQAITLTVNGTSYPLTVDNRTSLRDAIRGGLGLTGTKDGCSGRGQCGACTVLADGKAILSCLTLAVEAEGMKITTIEGVTDLKTGALSPLQQAFWANDGLQCGYCTPGFIMASTGLLAEIPKPTETQVREALAGNQCRCGALPNIIKSVLAAAGGS